MSFWISRTVTPLLCYYWLKEGRREHKPTGIAARGHRRLRPARRRLRRAPCAGCSSHRLVTIVGIAAFFVGSLLLKRFIGSEFFPETDESQFSITYKTPIGTRVERTEQVTQRIEKIVQDQLAPMRGGGKDIAHLHHHAVRHRPARGPDRHLQRQHRHPFGAACRSTWCRGSTVRSPTWPRPRRYARRCSDAVPGTQVFFFIGGIVKRIQNIGAAAPIDVEILGYDLERRLEVRQAA